MECSLDLWERKVRMDQRARRKLKQQQDLRAKSGGDGPAPEGDDPLAKSESRSKQEDIDDWQAQRLLSRNTLRQMIQEVIDDGTDQSERTCVSVNEQTLGAVIPDEAWHVKRVPHENEQVFELQRYVMRVVQYMAYCICGQQTGQLLAKIKGCQFAELLCRYDDCIRIAKWTEHNPFLDSSLIKMLICVFTHAAGHPIEEVAEILLRDLRVLQTGVCEERIRYPQLRMTKTIIISDVVAGFAITKYDWCGMAAFLRSYAQYSDILELNTGI